MFWCVYLPYRPNDGGKEQMELYMDTLGQIQCLIDQSDSEVPIIIIGVFNTVLPDTESLTEKWYCRKPYNKMSGILYEFLVQNDFVFIQTKHYLIHIVKAQNNLI